VVLVEAEPFVEYPDRAERLVAGLRGAGVDHERFIELIAAVAATNGVIDTTTSGSTPLIVQVGTPSRSLGHGPRLAHLVAWQLDTFTEKGVELLTRVNQLDLPDLRAEVLDLGRSWFNLASTDWLRLFEDRPEVTVRRDHASPAAWLAGKRILILGCGAIGGPVADACVRARAASVTVVDNGVVTPGHPGPPAVHRRRHRSLLTDDDPSCLDVDLIIDATADIGVRARRSRPHATAAPPRGRPSSRCSSATTPGVGWSPWPGRKPPASATTSSAASDSPSPDRSAPRSLT
jgi:hypothetical protein